MKKRIWIPAVILSVLCWGLLSFLGKEILPAAPLTKAWMVPFGASSYHNVVSGLIPVGSDRDHVKTILGEPDSEMVSISGDGRFTLTYSIPQNLDGGELLVSFNSDSSVSQIDLFEK